MAAHVTSELSGHAVVPPSDNPLITALGGQWKGIPVVHPFWKHSAEDDQVLSTEARRVLAAQQNDESQDTDGPPSALQERLEEVVANKKNQVCAECPNKFPQWAVLDRGAYWVKYCGHDISLVTMLPSSNAQVIFVPSTGRNSLYLMFIWLLSSAGILVCSLCAGVHREGVSQKIRSIAYDTTTWAKEENIAALENGGNAKNKAV